ncbi:MAG: tryptophan synthase subunit alpha [bacterium]|nr:tryptophan synthase subunit alpha [bacterium]
MIGNKFAELAARGETALMPYLTAGYPSLDRSLELLREVADNGADLIELGLPFSDPIADGPTIQYASHCALQNGTRLADVLQGVSGLDLGVPLILMSYLNPLLAHGRDALPADLAAVGISGLIVPDLTIDESAEWEHETGDRGVDLVQLVAPTSSAERMERIASRSRGFVYYVSVAGTTGARRDLPPDLAASLETLKRATATPVAVGFGISSPDHVRRLYGKADGAVVGSRVIEAIRDGENVGQLIRQLKEATKPC